MHEHVARLSKIENVVVTNISILRFHLCVLVNHMTQATSSNKSFFPCNLHRVSVAQY